MRKNKYGVAPKPDRTTLVDGEPVVFASKREMLRYKELALMERVGEISKLELQPRFPCFVDTHLVCTYVADFRYCESRGYGTVVVEDVKGVKTPIYRLKRKLVKALYGIEILET